MLSIFETVKAFRQDSPQKDDMTPVIVRILSVQYALKWAKNGPIRELCADSCSVNGLPLSGTDTTVPMVEEIQNNW